MNNFRPPFFYPPHYPHYFNNYQPYRSVQKNNKPQELLPTTSNSDNVKSNLEDEKKCDEHAKKRHNQHCAVQSLFWPPAVSSGSW